MVRVIRNIVLDTVLGTIAGSVLALVTFVIIAHAYVIRVNGWTTMLGCGEPSSSILRRGACAVEFPGPINVPQEAMYWRTNKSGAGRNLSGEHDYIMHFAPNSFPPNSAFWSLTMGDSDNRFVPNAINRYAFSNRSGLIPNADGSVDIYIQNAAPAAHEANWLPAPTGKFILWFRVYLPGPTVLDGTYRPPPVVEIQ